jgi:ABC-2 type transport system ATP-binding protein
VELVGIRHRHRGAGEVLAGVDLRVRAGHPTVVVGGNGSGKSTLLRIAAGALHPGGGTVQGRAAVVGYLPAPFPATSRFTAGRYLAHLDALHGLAPGSARPLLDALRFTGDPDGPVSALSTGNAAKVGLAQALAPGTGLVVLDEPWTALDDAAAEALTGLLAERATTTEILVADHTGRAAHLPGAVTHRLEGGRLAAVDGPDSTVPIPHWAHIELVCREPAAIVVRRLPPSAGSESSGSVLTATVAVDEADAWLAAALAAGCSVLTVARRTGRDR